VERAPGIIADRLLAGGATTTEERYMKMTCMQAKTTAKRDKAIEGVIAKHPELQSKSLGTGEVDGQSFPVTYSYINWMTEDGQTIIQIEVHDESNVERLASELKACGCVVNVMTEEEFDLHEFGETVGGVQ
jgi:hypothetical protein